MSPASHVIGTACGCGRCLDRSTKQAFPSHCLSRPTPSAQPQIEPESRRPQQTKGVRQGATRVQV